MGHSFFVFLLQGDPRGGPVTWGILHDQAQPEARPGRGSVSQEPTNGGKTVQKPSENQKSVAYGTFLFHFSSPG